MTYVERLVFVECPECGRQGLRGGHDDLERVADAGWHFALHIESLMMHPSEDAKLVEMERLLRETGAGQRRRVQRWLWREFHAVMRRLPERAARAFAQGVIEAAGEHDLTSRLESRD